MDRKKLNNLIVYGLTGAFVISFVTIAITGIVSLALFLLSPFAFADSISSNAQANARCLECHGKQDFSIISNGKKINLHVEAKMYNDSIHGTNACTSCHNSLGGDTSQESCLR